MGFDIGLKINKAILSDNLPDRFTVEKRAVTFDDISCLSRGFCYMVLSQYYPDNEPIVYELSSILGVDCSFIQEPKVNHPEEDEKTKFQFGWVNSIEYLSNLKKLKDLINAKPGFSKQLKLSDEAKSYFSERDDNSFIHDVDNLIEVLEICNFQGVTKICYTVG